MIAVGAAIATVQRGTKPTPCSNTSGGGAEQSDTGGDVERELKRLRVALDEIVQDALHGRVGSDVVEPFDLGSGDVVLHRPGLTRITLLANVIATNVSHMPRVTITLAHKVQVRYRVDGLREYHKTTLPYTQVFGPVSYPGLRLITCGGAFDYQTGHYVDNIVVYASIVSGSPHRAWLAAQPLLAYCWMSASSVPWLAYSPVCT